MKKIIVKRFIEYFTNKNLIKKSDKILVGVSGGIDSMALLSLLEEVKNKYSLTIGVAHVNYCLRGTDSDKDQKLVENYCGKNNISIYVHKIELRSKLQKDSLEVKAREVRYKFYDKICKEEGYQKIAIAHNANDNAETILLNLFRGSGIDGLRGIPVERENIIRPIIFLKRKELVQYTKENKIRFRHDKTNFQDIYKRNIIRLRLLPMAEKRINSGAIDNINKFSQIFSEFSEFIDEYVKIAVKSVRIRNTSSEFSLDIKKLNSYINFIREKVIISCYYDFTKEVLSYDKVLKILKISGLQTGRKLFLSKDIVLWKERDSIIFKCISQESRSGNKIKFKLYENVEIGPGTLCISKVDNYRYDSNNDIEFVDEDYIKGGLSVRAWEEGDYFSPLGMGGKKKLSDYLTDIKVSSSEKKSVLVLENSGKIVWVVGYRLDDRFKCTDKTKNIIKIELKRK